MELLAEVHPIATVGPASIMEAIIFLQIIFLDTPERLCFYTPPFGENPPLGRKEKAITMAAVTSFNNLFWFYYFYASVCPLLRRT